MDRYFLMATIYADDNLVKHWLDMSVKQNYYFTKNFIKNEELDWRIDHNARIKNKDELKKLINRN